MQTKVGTISKKEEEEAQQQKHGEIIRTLEDVSDKYLYQFRVPDWVLLYFKLEAKIPDKGRQTMINLTKLERTGVSHSKLLQY